MKASSSLRIGTLHLKAAVPMQVKANPITSPVVPSLAPKPTALVCKSFPIRFIPGDTGGPVDATRSTASLKGKHMEQQYRSGDEESKDDGEATEGQNLKKTASVSNVKPSSSPQIDSLPSKAAVPLAGPVLAIVVCSFASTQTSTFRPQLFANAQNSQRHR